MGICRLIVVFLYLLLAVATSISSVTAGEKRILQPGQRVRIDYDTTITKHFAYVFPYNSKQVLKVTGKLLSWDSSSLFVTTDLPNGQNDTIVISVVRNLYIGDGLRRLWLDGIGIGGLFGTLLVSAAMMGHREPPEEDSWVRRHPVRALGVFIGGGAIIGGIIGWHTRVDRWKKVDRQSWPIVPQLTLPHGGIRLGLTYKF